MEANYRHIFTDVMTSIGGVVRLLLAPVTGWLIFDLILAILIALNFLWEGWRIIRAPVDGLMDVSLSDHDVQVGSSAIEANFGSALEYHNPTVL